MDQIKKIFSVLIVGTVVSGFLGLCALMYFNLTLPSIENIEDYRPAIPSQILSSDGEVLLEAGVENREMAQFEEIPKVIIEAFLAAEDGNFYEHNGIDYMGILRALYKNIKAGRVVQGGSTITQQVAKQLLLTRERSISRKIKDALLALKIEKKISKEKILFLYLNKVYLGGGYYGIKAAVRGYFDKNLDEVTTSEAALLAGLLVAPGKYSPYINPKYSRDRQSYVLKRLLDTNKISNDEYLKAKNETLKLRLRKRESMKGGHFTDWIRQRVIAKVGKEDFLRKGYKIVTTLDWSLQKKAEKEILEGLKEIDKRQGFLGPIGHYSSDEEILKVEKEFRQSILKDQSNYFDLDTEGEKTYELDIKNDTYDEIVQQRIDLEQNSKFKKFVAGNDNNDWVLKLIEEEKNYDAIVIGVDDDSRMIYVSIGGIRGIIPYDEFKWAHKRQISEDKNLLPYVTRPKTIVKKGDVINVKVQKRSKTAYYEYWGEYRRRIKNKSILDLLKKQKFLLCSLDQDPKVEGALVALNPKDGSIISLVGGKDFFDSQFNRALQSQRQPGSAFKPVLYAAGLEYGFNPADIIMDTPEALGGSDDSLNWKPRNYDGLFKGPITFRRSLETSRNVPTIKMAAKVGVDKILEFLNRIRFNAKIAPDLSMSLGSFGITLLDLTSTYAIFPNEGRLVIPRSIQSISDADGKEMALDDIETDYYNFIKQENEPENKELEEVKSEVAQNDQGSSELEQNQNDKEKEKINIFHESLDRTQVYDKRLAYVMTNLLKGVIQNGTGRGAKSISPFIGGKTGTTNNYVDAWFLGFSTNLVLGVWTGFDDNSTLGWGETGAKSALPIWREYMKAGLAKFGEYDFVIPKGIINVPINKETGKILIGDSKNRFIEAFAEGTEPKSESDQELEDQNKAEVERPEKTNFLEDDDFFDS